MSGYFFVNSKEIMRGKTFGRELIAFSPNMSDYFSSRRGLCARGIPDQILEFDRLQKMHEMPLSLYEKAGKGRSGRLL